MITKMNNIIGSLYRLRLDWCRKKVQHPNGAIWNVDGGRFYRNSHECTCARNGWIVDGFTVFAFINSNVSLSCAFFIANLSHRLQTLLQSNLSLALFGFFFMKISLEKSSSSTPHHCRYIPFIHTLFPLFFRAISEMCINSPPHTHSVSDE